MDTLKTLSIAFALVGCFTLCAALAVAQTPPEAAAAVAAAVGLPPGAVRLVDALLALAVLALPTLLVGLTKYRRDGLGGAVMWLLDRASLAVHADSPGSLKLPLLQGSSAPDEARSRTSLRPGALALMLAGGLVLPAAHCPSVGRALVDVASCVAGDACGGIVGPLVESVAAAAMHATDAEWDAVVAALNADGGKCAGCLWVAVGARLHDQAPVVPGVPASAICKAAVAGERFAAPGAPSLTTGVDSAARRALAEARVRTAAAADP